MGFSLSWVAVRGKPAEEVHAILDLAPTGQTTDVPEGPACSAALGGWVLVVSDHCDLLVQEGLLATLSAGGEAVACSVEEHVMASIATAWRDGVEVWRAAHLGEDGDLRHLEVRGAPPPELARLRAAALAELEGEEDPADLLFDVPLDLARSLTGFKHDTSEATFEVLRRASRPSWLARLLGGRR
jgi:hypothetical protein